MNILAEYTNGNSLVQLTEDGTRTITTEQEDFRFDFPLNIDIRVSSACSLGYNPNTQKAICAFCHESARTDGKECDYEELKSKLLGLPRGIELAIGGNSSTAGLTGFLSWCKMQGYICNLTVNQLHINRDNKNLRMYLEQGLIKGLGVSYRKDFPINFDSYFIEHPNVVLHVIAGIDDVEDVVATPFKKVLVLGYKTFGFGVDFYDEYVAKNIQRWLWYVKKVMDEKDVTSFDNLALDQLRIKRFFPEQMWGVFNQGEHSFYINAVDKYFAPSSRDARKTPWDEVDIQGYFKNYSEIFVK
jgi:hypothetical protein